MFTILITDDDKSLRNSVGTALKEKYVVFEAACLKEAKTVTLNQTIDLHLVDMHLPDGTGHDFCKWIRKSSDAIVIFITVENDETVLIQCLEDGGDDYVTKPFSLAELESRIRANLRRLDAKESKPVFKSGIYVLNADTHQFFIGNEPVELTEQEYEIMELFLKANGRLLTRNTLLSYWDGQGNFVEENTLSVTVSRLRKKITRNGYCPILTIRGVGYRFVGEKKE